MKIISNKIFDKSQRHLLICEILKPYNFTTGLKWLSYNSYKQTYKNTGKHLDPLEQKVNCCIINSFSWCIWTHLLEVLHTSMQYLALWFLQIIFFCSQILLCLFFLAKEELGKAIYIRLILRIFKTVYLISNSFTLRIFLSLWKRNIVKPKLFFNSVENLAPYMFFFAFIIFYVM